MAATLFWQWKKLENLGFNLNFHEYFRKEWPRLYQLPMVILFYQFLIVSNILTLKVNNLEIVIGFNNHLNFFFSVKICETK